MANIAHKNLTGSDLHEPKGVASASVSTVYIADGVGSGVWGTLSAASAHAEIYSESDITVTVTSATSYVRWTPTDGVNETSSDITVAEASGTFTIVDAGTYRLTFQGSIRAPAGEEDEPVQVRFRVNGVNQAPTTTVEPSYVHDRAHVHITKLLELDAADVVDVAMTMPTKTGSVSVLNGTIQIEQVA